MSLWYLLVAAGVVFCVVFTPVLVWQILRRVTSGSTKVSILGAKFESPYASLVMSLVGVALIAYAIPKISDEQRVRVTNVTLALDGRTGPDALLWRTLCPATVRLTGTITGHGRGTVTYEFVRRQGIDGAPVRSRSDTVDFDGKQSISVTDSVDVTPPEGRFYYTDVLKITDPGGRESEPVGFTVWCDPTTDRAPPGMPPPPTVKPPGG
jgi:hypothetical protein